MGEGISCSIPARIGFLGNPSDGYFGECISLPVWNWQATVTLTSATQNRQAENPQTENAQATTTEPKSAESKTIFPENPGLCRIMEPTLAVFENKFKIESKPFNAAVETTIPRQVGLAGSSAIETAFMLALMAHNDIPLDTLSPRKLAELVLKVEVEELGMVAGLQDRLPQAFGCMLHMDFQQGLMEGRGFGEYTELDATELPQLWLAHAAEGKDSGETHSEVAARWEAKEKKMVEIIRELANCAAQGVDSIMNGETTYLSMLIDTNFELRRELFGDENLGETLKAVLLARSLGSCAKQTGSGGAIFGIVPEQSDGGEAEFTAKATPAFAEIGWTFHSNLEVGK